ncbi:MAG: uracil-DNA glycosylase family protein [Blastocatellia bacterium]
MTEVDTRDELRDLIHQAKEHLLYYRDLGLTNIGEAARPALAESLPIRVEQPMAVVSTPEPESVVIEPPIIPQSETPMKKTPAPPIALLESESATVTETLEDIRRDLGDCQRCKLWSTRAHIVFGEGNPNAELMFVGEAPGADEDASGRPFIGRAGQLLTKMIEAIEMKREDVYIANTLKSRPPDNRNPEPDETSACIPFVYRQIAAIRPKLIVTLGNPATQGLLETKVGITRIRGTFQDYPRIAGIKVLPTYHPAYLLRSPDKKREAWEDLKKVRAFLLGEIET